MLFERPARVWLGKVLLPWLALVSSLAAAGCGAATSPTAPVPATPVAVAPTPAPSPRVVIVSVDGLRGDALTADLTSFWGLARRGTYTLKARTVSPAQTLPAHASMLSGVDPKVHKMTWDDYDEAQGSIPVPTVFSIAEAAGLRTVMVLGKKKLEHLAGPGGVDTLVLATGDAEVVNEAIVQAGTGFDLMLVHLPDVDLTGHAEGWLSAAYAARVQAADAAVGRLLAALPPGTTVILTADHGGKGHTHGRDIVEDLTIPWIVAGPRVTRRSELLAAVKQTDTAATALWVLGLSPPAGCAGQVVQEAFVSQ